MAFNKIKLDSEKIRHYSRECGLRNHDEITSRLKSASHRKTFEYRLKHGFNPTHADELASLLDVELYQLEPDLSIAEIVAGADPKPIQ